MKIKVLTATSGRKLEDRVNDFIKSSGVKVLELQYGATLFEYTVMVVYEEIHN